MKLKESVLKKKNEDLLYRIKSRNRCEMYTWREYFFFFQKAPDE